MSGLQPSGDAQLHADLLVRSAGRADEVFATADSMMQTNADGGLPGAIDATVMGPFVPAECGDLLVLRVKMTAGTSGYIELGTSLTVP